jgi:hypothetical protein
MDEQEIAEELQAHREKKPLQKHFFPDGKDDKKRRYQDYRWNRFKNFDPRDMYTVVSKAKRDRVYCTHALLDILEETARLVSARDQGSQNPLEVLSALLDL